MIRHHERRKSARLSPDPVRDERDALIAAVRESEEHGHAPTVDALARYVARGRATGLDMSYLVMEFRSVYDRAVRGTTSDVRCALRRERLVSQLVSLYLGTH
jgi:hypothetical protein